MENFLSTPKEFLSFQTKRYFVIKNFLKKSGQEKCVFMLKSRQEKCIFIVKSGQEKCSWKFCMYRFIFDDLIKWKNSNRRKPLILQGARQVGKTWSLKEFGKKYYKKTAYFYFEKNTDLKNVFEKNLDPIRIIEELGILAGFKITPKDTLIFLDEIQECPNAITSLKYFYEQCPEYHIVVAGSLLGIALHSGVSFPVGKVNFMTLYPMSFCEFLLAQKKDLWCEKILNNDLKNLSVIHDDLISLVKKYLYIGGMPEVVFSFSKNQDYNEVREIQNEILKSYENDFSKHIPESGIPKLKMVWNSIPMQLAKENKKFVYGLIKTGARAKDFENAIEWLAACGLIYKIFRTKKIAIPTIHYEDLSAFKLYLSDVGLLSAMSGLKLPTLLQGNDIFSEFKGALTEQFVLQELKYLKMEKFNYWSNEDSTNEIDFLLQNIKMIVPVEVKSSYNLQSKSLKAFIEKYNIEKAFRISANQFKINDVIAEIPLYSIGYCRKLLDDYEKS